MEVKPENIPLHRLVLSTQESHTVTTSLFRPTLTEKVFSLSTHEILSPDQVREEVLKVVADCTGYDISELRPEHDLDADLGVDSLKSMEILLRLGEHFHLQPQEDEQTTDYPTINHLIMLACTRQNTASDKELSSPLVNQENCLNTQRPDHQENTSIEAIEKSHLRSEEEIQQAVLEVIANCTGYEVDELSLDHDLDADLGIDSLKNMEILLMLGERLHLQPQEGEQITDYPTIKHLVTLAYTQQETALKIQERSLSKEIASVGNHSRIEVIPQQLALDDFRTLSLTEVKASLLEIIANCTGYAVSELKPEHDLDADLGIDSLKNMEILLALGEQFHLQPQDGQQITDYPTIQHLLDLAYSQQNTALQNLQVASSSWDQEIPVLVGATVTTLNQVTETLAQMRNYEASWLSPNLKLITDLGMTDSDLQTFLQALGLNLTLNGHRDFTLMEVAHFMTSESSTVSTGSEHQKTDTLPITETLREEPIAQGTIPGQKGEDWILILGQADPQHPDLSDRIHTLIQTYQSPILKLVIPGSKFFFAVVLDRASKHLLEEITQKVAIGSSAPLQGIWWENIETAQPGSLAWVVPGSGSLYAGLLDELKTLSPVVDEVLQGAQAAYQKWVGKELSFECVKDPLYQRPATVTASTAMARLLESFGIKPDFLAGHSVGELTACHLAGAFDLEELIRLTVAPFQHLESYPDGSMVALLGPEETSRKLVLSTEGRVVVSNRNSSQQLVVSGSTADIQEMVIRAEEIGIKSRLLDVETAYHSPLLGQAHHHYRQALETTSFHLPARSVVSGLTGDIIPWSQVNFAQVRALLDCAFIAPVNYVAQLQRLQSLGITTLIDVGPTARLARLAQDTLDPKMTLIGLNRAKRSSRLSFLEALAKLHTMGYSLKVPDPIPFPIPTVEIISENPALLAEARVQRPTLLDPIAVVGMGGILPDASNIAEFWQNILSGHSAIREIPQDEKYRWKINTFYHPDPKAIDKTYCKIGAFIPPYEFKPMEFRLTPKAAAYMDRAQVISLLAARDAFQDSGYETKLFNRQRVRVILGTTISEYKDLHAPRLFFDTVAAGISSSPIFQSLPQTVQSQILDQARDYIYQDIKPLSKDSMVGELPNLVAGRIAFCFDLQGGNVVLDAACASSLAAIDHAIKCLRLGEADIVVTGGVDTNMGPNAYVGFCKTYALSACGSSPFDAKADGFVMGEGVGIFILKRLQDAEQSQDKIYAVIRGIGSSSDGKGKGVTAPSISGQVLAMERAYADAGIDPKTVGLIEAHGTSTPVGDSVEFGSLCQFFGDYTKTRKIYLGSVKSMIGHLKAAAGAAGLIKAILSVQSGLIPPTRNFSEPNPQVDLVSYPFVINTDIASWQEQGVTPRRAGINAFGFGGTNYHMVIEAYDSTFYRGEAFLRELESSHLYKTLYQNLPSSLLSGYPEVVSSQQSESLKEPGSPLMEVRDEDLVNVLRTLYQPLGLLNTAQRDEQKVALIHYKDIPAFLSDGSLAGLVPKIEPQDLGARSFQKDHGTRFNYVAGAMAGGISSVDIVVTMAKSGMLGFFGSGGVSLEKLEKSIYQIHQQLMDYPQAPTGFNLLHNPMDPDMEERTVDLYLRKGVHKVSASAYLRLTPTVVRYRASGMKCLPDGRILAPNKVFAKLSSPEIAAQFMSPPPATILKRLVEQGKLTAEEAELAAQLPVAQDITAEADSGGHTDRRPLSVLLPQILRLRDEMMSRYGYQAKGVELRVGSAGSIGDPLSVRAALALGADYILTGSINQASLQAGTSSLVKDMLSQAEMSDVVMAPAADMFEMGVQVQILKRGTFYSQRARKLYDIYKTCAGLDAIPPEEKNKLERDIFRQPLQEVWDSTESYWQKRDPKQLEKAKQDPKFQMALTFRAYLGLSSRWAQSGQVDRKSDFQIWCGAAMGLFNNWVRGTWLDPVDNRDVALMGLALLHGAAVLTRSEYLSRFGVSVPPRIELTQPADRDVLLSYLS